MFITNKTYFKCPYCNHEYERIVGSGTSYRYKDSYYDDEICPNCGQKFLYNINKFCKMPEDKNELKYFCTWMS